MIVLSDRTLRVLGVFSVIGFWWLAVPSGGSVVPTLGEIAEEMTVILSSGKLMRDVSHSLLRVVLGIALAFTAAVAISAISFLSRAALLMVSGALEVVRPVPPIAWVPLIIMWLGIGNMPAIATVVLGAFFPIWLGIQQGAAEVRREYVWAARSLGASPYQVLREVGVPAALPYVLHGFRIGLGLGWFCLVAAEMMGAQQGLGHAVHLFSLNLQTPAMFGYIFVIGGLGLGMTEVLNFLEMRILYWHKLSIKGHE